MVITGARHKDEILEAVEIIKDELADLLKHLIPTSNEEVFIAYVQRANSMRSSANSISKPWLIIIMLYHCCKL